MFAPGHVLAVLAGVMWIYTIVICTMQCQEGCAIVTLILVRYSLHLDPEVLLELAGTVIWNLKLIWCDSWPGPASARL